MKKYKIYPIVSLLIMFMPMIGYSEVTPCVTNCEQVNEVETKSLRFEIVNVKTFNFPHIKHVRSDAFSKPELFVRFKLLHRNLSGQLVDDVKLADLDIDKDLWAAGTTYIENLKLDISFKDLRAAAKKLSISLESAVLLVSLYDDDVFNEHIVSIDLNMREILNSPFSGKSVGALVPLQDYNNPGVGVIYNRSIITNTK